MPDTSARPNESTSASQKTHPVVTRFAPSPTGFLHIGGARTALFNWAFARHHGGKFLLRVEDTDRTRSTQAAIDAIINSMDWLGLAHDGAVVFQQANTARHIEIAAELLAKGHAYKCTCTAQELEKKRDGGQFQYDGTCRDKKTPPENASYVIRFKAPQTAEKNDIIINDAVQGQVVFSKEQFDDLVLVRSDGTPTYMLAVVVDDHDMGITHIIRGDDHLTNAARQQQIYDALGWDTPIFAHIPLIHGADGAKLSKRHGAVGVENYRDMGYLPEAMRNYLARLGWSHGDDELFSTEQLIEWFDLAHIGKSPSRFNTDKLDHVNAHYLAHRFVHEPPQQIEEKLQRALNAETLPLLTELATLFGGLEDWTGEPLKHAFTAFMEEKGLKMGQIGPALRACLTGTTKSPGIYDVMLLLGRGETIARINAQIAKNAG